MATEAKVRQIKQEHSRSLMSRPGVTAVGVERDAANPSDYFLAVHLDTDDPNVVNSVPKSIGDCDVRVVTTQGRYTKQ